jgi:LacI family transcriptional regulator, galactose operon repressor
VRRRPVTLSDVARAAGVSKSTVSNVVRGASPVAPETRSRVESAVRELGYRPNGVARALREKTSTVLGLIVPDAVNPFYGQLALGVERRAHADGYGVLIANTECDPAIERAQLDALVSRRVDGVLVGGLAQGSSLHVELLDRGIPVVCAFPAPPDPRLGLVDTDDERAMGEVVAHLHALGHRRCAFASHGLAEAGAEARQVAFEAAARQRGIAIVGLDEGPTAIAAHNDSVAIQQIDVLEGAGLRVPQDVSVVGFDDVPLASHRRIALTTVRSDGVRVGEVGAELLLDAVRDGRDVATRALVPAELVVRGSTGPAPREGRDG